MNTLLQHGITAQAEARPGAIALAFRGTHMSYGELEGASNRLAHLLRDAGCRRGDRVGLLMPKTPSAIVGILGALKAGAIYVPLDPASPAARLARMLDVSGCRYILASGDIDALLQRTLETTQRRPHPLIGWLDAQAPADAAAQAAFTLRDLDAYPATPPASANADSDVAHILFTSGSTGLPKGVMITHRNVLHFIRWAAAYFGTTSTDRISQHPPLHFDLSTFDIFCTLSAGAQLHLIPAELSLLPHKLAQFMREAQLTQWFSVPAVLNLMSKFNCVDNGDFPALRRVMWCGEAIQTTTLIDWMRRLPHVRFTNLYGPTEATIASSYYTVPRPPSAARTPIPIGTACAGEELLVLDSRMQPVPPGEIGDLYIRGVGLSPGYWGDPQKTDAVFLPCPGAGDTGDRIYKTGDLARRTSDGLFHFAGRADTQIKCRGYRIELGEIEAALGTLPGLHEGAIIALPSSGFEAWIICCAFVALPNSAVCPADLRAGLARVVPAYMLPTRWMSYTVLPKNSNGKIDRPRLRADFQRTTSVSSNAPAETASARAASGDDSPIDSATQSA